MAIRLPVTPISGHVSRAISFSELPNMYLGLGKTSAFLGEDDPNFVCPPPSVEAKTLEELIGLKRIEVVSLVHPDPDGTLIYKDRSWKKVSVEDAIRLGSRWVYLEVTVNYEELPAVGYRQIGIFSRVQANPEVGDSKSVLLPDEILSTGLLEIFEQRKVVHRSADSKDTFSMIVEF